MTDATLPERAALGAVAELLAPRPRGVLTVYIPAGPVDDNVYGFRQRFEEALGEARRHLPRGWRPRAMRPAAEQLRRHVGAIEHPPAGALVLIGSDDAVEHAIPTALPVPLFARFARQACLAPLLLAAAHEPGALAVLIDDNEALLFGVGRQRLPVEHVHDEIAGRHKRGGWSQSRFQRHHEDEIHAHYARAAAEIAQLLTKQPVPWIVVGGRPESRAGLEAALPERLREHVAGHFNGQFHQPLDELAALARPPLVDAAARADITDLERVIDASAKGGNGAFGWGPVLGALAEGAVRELFCPLLPEPLAASRDDGGALSAVPVGAPSWITGEPTLYPAELPFDAVHDAVLQGARLRAVDGEAAARLRDVEGIAAGLRFH